MNIIALTTFAINSEVIQVSLSTAPSPGYTVGTATWYGPTDDQKTKNPFQATSAGKGSGNCWYSGNSNFNESPDPSNPYYNMYAATNSGGSEFGSGSCTGGTGALCPGQQNCGQCYNIKCNPYNSNSYSYHCNTDAVAKVMVVDACPSSTNPSCAAATNAGLNHFDISPQALTMLTGTTESGYISIQWQRTPC